MKYFKTMTSALLALLIMVSCSSKPNENNQTEIARDQAIEAETYEENNNSEQSSLSVDIKKDDRKVIVNYELELSTEKYAKSLDNINKIVKEKQGYPITIEENANTYSKYARLIYEIPKDQASNFVDEIIAIKDLNLRSKNMTTEDQTSQYVDNELRIKVLNDKLERLLELQKQATDVEYLLKIESDIAKTIYEIENLKGTNSNIDDRVKYTKVTIILSEVGQANQIDTEVGFSTKISNAIKESASQFSMSLQALIIFIIYLIPYILIIGLAILIFRFIYKKYRKKHPKKKMEFIKFNKKDSDQKPE